MTTRASITSNTPAPYKFELISNRGTLICDHEPKEWKEGITKLKRDMESAGVFNSYVVSTLTFIGNARQLLYGTFWADGSVRSKGIFLESEINAECNLRISWFDPSVRRYLPFPTDYKLLFGSFKIVKLGKHAIGVSISCTESSTLAKFNERKKVNLNLASLKSISGLTITEQTGFPLLSKLKIPALSSVFYAKLFDQCLYLTDTLYSLYALSAGKNSVPLIKSNNDFAEVQGVLFEFGQTNITDLTPVFLSATEEKTLTFNFNLWLHVDDANGFNGKKCTLKYAVYNGITEISVTACTLIATPYWNIDELSGDLKSTGYIYTDNPFGHIGEMYYSLVGYFDVTLQTGQSLYFYVDVEDNTGNIHWVRPTLKNVSREFGTYLTISQTVVNTSEVKVYGLTIYDALNRACQIMLDRQFPFYCEFFGRNDVYYDQSTLYTNIDDNTKFGHILSGVNIRGLSIYDPDGEGKINITWEQLFKSVSAWYCLGYSLETILGAERIRVENRSFFFNDTEILDISDRINQYDIVSEYLPEMAYIEIITGYENYVFESSNGRGEYNTENTRTTQLNASEKLDLKSEISASTMSIVNCLKKPIITTGSEDTDKDEKVFIIKSLRETVTTTENAWIAELPTDGNITIENDSSLFKDSSLNLHYTPTRNLRRNSELFTPALRLQLSAYLRFMTSGKLSNLRTTGEGYTISENEDIRLNDLDLPYLMPMKHTVDVQFSRADLALLLATGTDNVPNKYKLIKFTSNISGWILEVNMKNAEEKASISIIQKYVP